MRITEGNSAFLRTIAVMELRALVAALRVSDVGKLMFLFILIIAQRNYIDVYV